MSVVQIGVSAAVQAKDVSALNPDDVPGYFRDLAAQMLPRLEEYVGSAPMKGDPHVNVQGPVDDALQGVIYAVSLAAPFETEELPSHCKAYTTYVTERMN